MSIIELLFVRTNVLYMYFKNDYLDYLQIRTRPTATRTTMTRLTHAIIIRVPPRALKIDDKKLKVDFELVRKQQEDLCDTLREAGLDVIELAPEENAVVQSLFADDAAIVINGTALIGRLCFHFLCSLF